MAVDEYGLLCTELASATAQRDADVRAAEQSYVDGVAALTADITSAEAALSTVDGQVRAARRRVGRIDAHATTLWGRAADVLGRRVGALPGPILSTVDAEPATALRHVDTVLRRYRLGPVPVRLPRRFVVALPLLGAVGAVPVVGAGHALGIGLLSLVLAPFPGLLAARTLAHRRYAGWLDVGAVALTMFGALLGAGAALVMTS